MSMRDAVYARISEDDLGTEKGVTRQLEDGRALSAARGGRVVMELHDNDVSALSGAPRPGYRTLMDAVAAGQIDRVIVFHTSRLWRNRRERTEGIEKLKAAGVSVVSVKGPELDLSTAAGRMMAGILGEFDTAESEIKGERVARAALQRAQEGRANGAALYGWRRIYTRDDQGRVTGFGDEIDEDEAAVVRSIVANLLDGMSLRAVTEDLNEREVPAPGAGQRRSHRAKGQDETGARWNKTSVKKIATRPANVALRVHHRRRPDEALLPASWPAIVSTEDHERVVVLLHAPDRGVKAVARPGARVHLLSWGIGECGVCGGHLRVGRKGNTKYGTRKLLYLCDAKGCVGRDRDSVDDMIGRLAIKRMAQPDAARLLERNDRAAIAAERRVETLKTKLLKAADDWTEDRITADMLHRITARLKPQLAQAEAAARAVPVTPHAELVMSMIGEKSGERWAGFNLDQRRAVLSTLLVAVRILPVIRRGPGFDPRTVDPVWRVPMDIEETPGRAAS
ncbi:recombinase family protein [Dactylosporangium sp. NPDC051541]|uniref:recombinase family protein n=1 Tax=Dactylosporangium sp. NPDC051541 TaxID=3363977 RepID=UPI00378FE3F0